MTGSLAGKRILIVEDEFFIAADMMRAVEDAGGEVFGPVGELSAGMALADVEQIDAALLDINLGGTLSYPIADMLAKRAIPFVFLTGYDQDARPGAYAHVPSITKPFPNAAILDALQALVGAKAAQ